MNPEGMSERSVALVTGAGSGIGRATASLFATRGHSVAVVDIDHVAATTVAEEISAGGGSAIAVEADVTIEDAVAQMIDTVLARWGRLDIAHNNAGLTASGLPMHAYDKPVWDRTIALDLTAVWLCMKHELTVMAERRSGAIVNTASIAGHIGYLNSAPYTAAKHGVVGLTRSAAVDYGPLGIRVNAVSPGPVQTPMLDDALTRRGPDAREWYLQNTPMGRFATVDEVAYAVCWLASDEASFVTGHCLSVDGGWTAQ